MISVIIPTQNSARLLPATFQCLFDAAINGIVSEVIVCDAGSTDATAEIAEQAGATVIEVGEGQEHLAGAEAARKPWLLFLKPGAVLDNGWEDEVRAFMAKGESGAAGFRFAVAGKGVRSRLRGVLLSLCAGAIRRPACRNALLIPARLLDAVGGFSSMPPMTEADLMRRLGRGRIEILRARVILPRN